MDAITDNVRRHLVVGKHFTEDARLTMIQRPHGIERMRSMVGTGGDRALRHRHLCIGVPDADAHSAPRRFRDDLHGSGYFWCDRQHSHVSTRGLPKAVEDRNGGLDQIFRRMDSASFVAEKGSFEMNTEWPSLRGITVFFGCSFDRAR